MATRRSHTTLRAVFSMLFCWGIVWASLVLCPTVAYADIASGTYDNVPWRVTDDGALLIGTEGQTTRYAYQQYRDEGDFPWIDYTDDIKSVKFLGTVEGNGSHDTMFAFLPHATTIDLGGFDTSRVESMAYMFCGCEALDELNVSGFDTTKVTSMQFMFSQCTSLAELDLSGFNVSNVDSFTGMLGDCTSLATVDMTGWSPKSTAETEGLFSGCEGLQAVDLSLFAPVTIDNDMLGGVNGLMSITLGANTRLDTVGFSSSYTWSHNMADAFSGAEMLDYDGADPGTYYAVYKVSFDPGTGSGTADPVYTPIDSAGSYQLPDVPNTLAAPEHSEFDAWDKGEPGATISLTGDTTLTATWKLLTYTITWSVDGTTTKETYTYGKTPVFTGSTDKASDDEYSYTFDKWSPNVASVEGNQTYTAQYNQTAHTWGTPNWTWNAGLTSASVGLTCADCDYHLDKTASIESKQTLDPSCTKKGTQTYTATAVVNGTPFTSTKTKDIDALGHDFPDTWTSSDAGHWHVCGRCGQPSDVEVHASSGAATEENPETCGICGYEIAPALGHIHRNHLTFVGAADPTCTGKGNVAHYLCSCGKTFADADAAQEIDDVEVAALGHDFSGAWRSDASGHWRLCSRCEQPDEAQAHTSGGPATEDDPETCTTCGYEIAPALGHVHRNHLTRVKATDPTCTKKGTIAHYRCSCGKLFSDSEASSEVKDASVAALGHDFSGAWHSSAKGHWHVCSRCGVSGKVAPHVSSGPATEDTPETCTTCGYVITPELSHVHRDHLTRVEAVASTCTEKGAIAHYRCSCGALFADAAASRKVDDVSVPALGHNYSSAWHADAEGHWHVCSRCGARSGVEAHVSGGAATVERGETCSICGYTMSSTRTITSEVIFENTGDSVFEPLYFRQTSASQSSWTMTLPERKPQMTDGYFEWWACSHKSGTFTPGESLTFAFEGAERVVFTGVWTPLIRRGTSDLTEGRYRLDVDVQSLAGDPTVYTSDQYVYVPEARSYTFS